MEVSLVMFTPTGERRDFVIAGKKAIIGRNTECEIQIQLGVVSRRHCQVRIKEGAIKVRDLGSSNGTYVNDNRIQEAELHAGDKLTVGPVIFTVVVDGEPEEIESVPTVLETKKETKSRPRPQPRSSDDSGSIDMEESGTLDLVADDDEDERDASSVNPLAALEELSKPKKP